MHVKLNLNMNTENTVKIIGGGLAGSEAAWQAAQRGMNVQLYEMRPVKPTPAHQTDNLAEIVCSNSLKTDEQNTAPRLLKDELRKAGSLLLEIAGETRVPAGAALAVDRDRFSNEVTNRLSHHPRIKIIREEVVQVSPDDVTVVATGPLTSPALSAEIGRLTGNTHLYFYDAIAPVVDAETIDYEIVFKAARYDKGGADYINCPFTEEQYQRFYDALMTAEQVPLHSFEDTQYFESCLPIEEMARRGRDTLRFGPMKPVGLIDPKTGRIAYAAVQLRQENLMADSYNLVGFQNHLKFGDQKRVLQLIPGLERAEFLKFGQIHRNTYINAPVVLNEHLQMRTNPRVLFAGQVCGVEGYVESIAAGLIAGINAAAITRGDDLIKCPRESAIGSLLNYIANCESKNFQPMNMTFGLLPQLDESVRRRFRSKQDRHRLQIETATQAFDRWLKKINNPATYTAAEAPV